MAAAISGGDTKPPTNMFWSESKQAEFNVSQHTHTHTQVISDTSVSRQIMVSLVLTTKVHKKSLTHIN